MCCVFLFQTLASIPDEIAAFNQALALARISNVLCVYILRRIEHRTQCNRMDLREKLIRPPLPASPILSESSFRSHAALCDFLFLNLEPDVQPHHFCYTCSPFLISYCVRVRALVHAVPHAVHRLPGDVSQNVEFLQFRKGASGKT